MIMSLKKSWDLIKDKLNRILAEPSEDDAIAYLDISQPESIIAASHTRRANQERWGSSSEGLNDSKKE
jgi:hypothetical protein